MIKSNLLTVLTVFLSLFIISCNSNSNSPTVVEEEKTEVKKEEKKEEPKADVVEIELNSNDKMQFDKNEIEVPAGSKVKLTLIHTGEMDIKVMGHNFVLLKADVDMVSFATDAMTAKDNDYIPADRESEVIAHTKTIGGGDKTSITFEAPEAGTYDFLCTFPGHYSVMNGKFIVK